MMPQDVAEEADWDAIYGGIDVDESSYKQPEKIKHSYTKILKDIAKQSAKQGLSGLGGTAGSLLDLVGAQAKEQLPGQKARSSQDWDILNAAENGQNPSLADLMSLSEDEPIPSHSRLPSTQDLQGLNDMLGGPGEAETGLGRYAGRIANIYGSGLPFGQLNPIPAIAGGVAGQGVEDLGGGPLIQSAAEIAGMLTSHVGHQYATKPMQSANAAKEAQIQQLRALGYSDQDITLALNAANKGGKTAQKASRGAKTDRAFENAMERSEQLVSDIISGAAPGIQQGTKHIHQVASDLYGNVAKEAANLTITNSRPFLNAAKSVTDELQKTLGKNPEAQEFIRRISDAAIHSTNYPNADSFMNFYKELNGMGKWVERSQKDRLITTVKNGIKDTFRQEGPQGRQLAQRFEEANSAVQKAYQVEDAVNLLDKANTLDGWNWNGLKKTFDKQENWRTLEDAFGPKATENLYQVAKTGKEIGDFNKAYQGLHKLGIADIARIGGAGYYLYEGDWLKAAGVLSTKAGSQIARKLREQSLTNPKFQSIQLRALNAIKNQSPQAFKRADEAMKKYLEEEGIPVENY